MTPIELLKEIKKKNSLQIYVPSKDKTVAFSHLTFQHYNELLALSNLGEDIATQTLKFNNLLNKIILECCLDSINILDELTIVDRNVIALQLRVAIDDHFQFIYNGKPIDVTLKEHCNLLAKLGNFSYFTKNPVTYDNIELILDIPTLYIDQQINNEILTYDKESEQFPAFLLFAEIIKYISQIKIGDIEVVKLYQTDKIIESLYLCQQLPLPLLNLISTYISNVQKEEQKLMSVGTQVNSISSENVLEMMPNTVIDNIVKVPIIINSEWFTSI